MADYTQASSAFDPSAQGAAYAQQLFALQQAMQGGGGGGGGGNYASGGGSETNIDITGMRLLNDEKLRAARQMGAYGAQMDKKAADAAHAREMELLQMKEALAMDRADKEFGQAKELEGMKFGQGMQLEGMKFNQGLQLEDKRFGNEMAITDKKAEYDRKIAMEALKQQQEINLKQQLLAIKMAQAGGSEQEALQAELQATEEQGFKYEQAILRAKGTLEKTGKDFGIQTLKVKDEYVQKQKAMQTMRERAAHAVEQTVPGYFTNQINSFTSGLGAASPSARGSLTLGAANLLDTINPFTDKVSDTQIHRALGGGALSYETLAAAARQMPNGELLFKTASALRPSYTTGDTPDDSLRSPQRANAFSNKHLTEATIKALGSTSVPLDPSGVSSSLSELFSSVQMLEGLSVNDKEQAGKYFNMVRNGVADTAMAIWKEPGHEAELLDLVDQVLLSTRDFGTASKVKMEGKQGLVDVDAISLAAIADVGDQAGKMRGVFKQAGKGHYLTEDELTRQIAMLDTVQAREGGPNAKAYIELLSGERGPLAQRVRDIAEPNLKTTEALLEEIKAADEARAGLAFKKTTLQPGYVRSGKIQKQKLSAQEQAIQDMLKGL